MQSLWSAGSQDTSFRMDLMKFLSLVLLASQVVAVFVAEFSDSHVQDC